MSDQEQPRRHDDAAVARVEQKIDDFLERYAGNEREANEWREGFERRLKPIEDVFERLKGPWQVFIWSVALIFTYPIYSLGRIIFDWVRTHLK